MQHKNFAQNGQFDGPKGAASRSQLGEKHLPTKLMSKSSHLASTAKPKVGFAYQQPNEVANQELMTPPTVTEGGKAWIC